MTTVTSTAALLAVLKNAAAGAVITLAPGSYAPIISNFHGAVTIQSANPLAPAKITALSVKSSSGILFQGLEFDASHTVPSSYGPAYTNAFQVYYSDHISFNNLNVHGSPTGTVTTDVSGMLLEDSTNITVSNSQFHNLYEAVAHVNVTGLLVSGNHFYLVDDDGVRGGGSSYVTIQNNHCDSLDPSGANTHPDCIQFWTTSTTTSAHDITVTGNTYQIGSGTVAQGIFFGNERKIPYYNITISNNSTADTMYNAIMVTLGNNVSVSGNSICQTAGHASWLRMINVNTLKMTNNKAPMYIYTNVLNLSQSNNVQNQGYC